MACWSSSVASGKIGNNASGAIGSPDSERTVVGEKKALLSFLFTERDDHGPCNSARRVGLPPLRSRRDGSGVRDRVGLNLTFDNGGSNVRIVAHGVTLKGSGNMHAGTVTYPMFINSGYVKGNYVYLVGVMQGASPRMPFTITANKVTGNAGWSINGGGQNRARAK